MQNARAFDDYLKSSLSLFFIYSLILPLLYLFFSMLLLFIYTSSYFFFHSFLLSLPPERNLFLLFISRNLSLSLSFLLIHSFILFTLFSFYCLFGQPLSTTISLSTAGSSEFSVSNVERPQPVNRPGAFPGRFPLKLLIILDPCVDESY